MDAKLETPAGVSSRGEAGNFAVMRATGRGKAADRDGERVTQVRKCGWRQFGGCGDCGL